ncbi:tectonic [Toxorhynchites rutilus septentrionalis]|uniref:tectonic n=1 Tax=Toxorhynchites rutilus septentrionalis TaxID=329112 RepID=UPI0024793C91|nr:tectonic [Toxorhynchites rutilus septentrionalis]
MSMTKSSEQDRGARSSFVKIDISKGNQPNESTAGGIANMTTTTTTATTFATKDNSNVTVETATAIGSTTSVSSGTTLKTQSTTNSPTTTITIPPEREPEIPKEGRSIKVVPSGYYCRCDLKINICDVNCCCDIDCSDAILKTFDCNEERLDVAEYHHQEGLQSCEVQGGLFCLIDGHHGEGDQSHYDPTRKYLSSKHKWKEIFGSGEGRNLGPASTYRVNGILQLYNETSERLGTFTIPYSITNSHCQINQPVRFLRDQTSSCIRTLEELETSLAAFVTQQSTVRYLRVPKTENLMEHCMDDDCFNSTVQYCNLAGRDCQSSNRTGADTDGDADGTWYCPELQIVMLHNYTYLEGVEIKLQCGIAELSTLESDTVWQSVRIEFKRRNENHFSRQVSGNLGYLKGKPLIVSRRLIPANASLEERKQSKKYMLGYFTNGTRAPDETFRLRLPKSRKNRCVLNDQMHHNVLFGENIWSKCNFYPQLNVTTESNFTEICLNLQEEINSLLLRDVALQLREKTSEMLNLYLSKYGNPVNRSLDWVQFRALNVIDEKVTASWSQPAAFFKCNSMLINVNYHIFHGRTTVRNVPRQHVAQEAEIVLGPRVDLQFPLDEEIRVPLFAQVQFFDLTSCGSRLGTTLCLVAIKFVAFMKLMLI